MRKKSASIFMLSALLAVNTMCARTEELYIHEQINIDKYDSNLFKPLYNELIITKGNVKDISKDDKIQKALVLLRNNNAKWVIDALLGENKTYRPVKVRFRDIGLIDYSYYKADALTCLSTKGDMYIFISNRHKNAPAQAIASILCHEILHQDKISSIEEEVQGWMNEAKQWIIFKEKYPELKDKAYNIYPLVRRLNKIEKMYVSSNYTDAKIRDVIANHSTYKNLAMTSPGFK